MNIYLISYLIFSFLLTLGVIVWMVWIDYKHGPDHKFGYSLRYNKGYPYFLGIPDFSWWMIIFTFPIINIFVLVTIIYLLFTRD